MNNINEVIKEILEIIGAMDNAENIGGSELSENALKLAIYKVYVGQELVKQEYQTMVIEHSFKEEKNASFVKEREAGAKIADADITAMEKKKKKAKELYIQRYKTNKLKVLRQDTESVITVIQSRLSQLKSEMVEAKS